MSSILMTTIDAAAYLGLSPKTLERFRCEGNGPVFVKAGPGKRARVRYRQRDLDAWLDGQTYTATSQYPNT